MLRIRLASTLARVMTNHPTVDAVINVLGPVQKQIACGRRYPNKLPLWRPRDLTRANRGLFLHRALGIGGRRTDDGLTRVGKSEVWHPRPVVRRPSSVVWHLASSYVSRVLNVFDLGLPSPQTTKPDPFCLPHRFGLRGKNIKRYGLTPFSDPKYIQNRRGEAVKRPSHAG